MKFVQTLKSTLEKFEQFRLNNPDLEYRFKHEYQFLIVVYPENLLNKSEKEKLKWSNDNEELYIIKRMLQHFI